MGFFGLERLQMSENRLQFISVKLEKIREQGRLISLIVLCAHRFVLFDTFQLMVDSLSGLSTPSVAGPVVRERKLAPVNAPTHPRQGMDCLAREVIRRL